MSTIFPREEKAEQIFDEILKNPHACERLKDTFFEAIPSAEESEVQEQTFRELFLRQLYLLHTKIKICLHL